MRTVTRRVCFKMLLALPFASLSSLSMAQSVTYSYPVDDSFSPTSRILLASGTQTVTTTGCPPPYTGDNGTVSAPTIDSMVQTMPWEAQAGSTGSDGNNFGFSVPWFYLPPALQPATALVAVNGVSQSSGQTFAPATITGAVPAPGSGSYAETYVASVTGTNLVEKFNGSYNEPLNAAGISKSGQFERDSTYAMPTFRQVFSATNNTTFTTTNNPAPGCVQTTVTNDRVAATSNWSPYPALVIAAILPPATVGVPYKAQLVSGGSGPDYPIGIVASGIPPGLVFNGDGTITGVPTAPVSGTQTFTISIPSTIQFFETEPPVTSSITVTASSGSTCSAPAPPPPAPGSSWYQLDPAWASQPYMPFSDYHAESGPHTTIGDRGDMLTALAYMLSSAGVSYTPATLDEQLVNHSYDFSWSLGGNDDGGSISLGSSVIDVSLNRAVFGRSAARSFSTSDLDTYLCRYALPVMLQVTDPASGYRHYVVATGKQNGGYTIVDPGFKNRTNLSAYGNRFMIMGTLQALSGVISELDISAVDNATVFVTAPDGSSTGVSEPNATPVQASTDAAYFAIDNAVVTDTETIQPTSTTYTVQLFMPTPGSYTINAVGLHTGVYYLSVQYANPLTRQVAMAGFATLGSMAQFKVLTADANGVLRFGRVASFATALADVANAQKIGLLTAASAQTLTGFLLTAQQASTVKDAAHEQQELQALNTFKTQVLTLPIKVDRDVLGGDVDALIAVVP